MLKKSSDSTEITPLVNSAVEKLQELGMDCSSCLVMFRGIFIYLVSYYFDSTGHSIKTRKYGVEQVDTSGVEVVIKALRDLVMFITFGLIPL